MKRFGLNVLLFLFPMIVLLALIECYVRQLPNSYKYKNEWMWKNGPDVSTLFLGNSHAFFDLNPREYGDSTFNLANVSQRLQHDYFLICHYATACPNLKTVILVVDNSNLFDIPMENDEPGRVTYYQLYMGYSAHSAFSRYSFELADINSFWAKMKNHWHSEGLSCDSLGWGNGYLISLRNPKDFLVENVRTHCFVDWRSTNQNVKYVRKIAQWCQKHDMTLFLLMPPVTSSYTRKAEKWQLDFVRHVVDSCRTEYGAMVVDYSCDTRFDDDDFFDTDHLNDIGAQKFSKLLKEEIGKFK